MSASTTNQDQTRPPKLRDDLEITRQQTPEGVAYVVRDPLSGRFCRFGETEHFLAQQCDGQKSLDEVRQRVEAEFDAAVPGESLQRFLDKLRELDLLEPEEGDSRRQRQLPGRLQGSTLHLRVKLFDPDRLLQRLARPLGFVFSGGFLLVSAGLILLAAWVALENRADLGGGAAGLLRPGMILPGLAVMFATILVHEFAHGLTCRRFGGPVHEIGFLLIYFLPAFYCDVSSAWAFSEKRKRLWVTFAGAWCDLLMWAVAVLGWRVTQPETWVNTLCLLVAAATGLRSLFNLNPLIKLDGYYLLSDWLEIPNLRQRAFDHLGTRIKGVFGNGLSQPTADASARQRRVFVTYGTLAGVYSVLLLSVVGFKAGGFLMGRFQALGFLAFVGLLTMLVRRPLGRLLYWPAAMARSGSPKASRRRKPAGLWDADASGSSAPKPAWPLKLAVFLGGIASLLYFGRWPLSVAGDVEVTPIERAKVRAEVAGLIEEVFVKEGMRVSPGEPIVRLAGRDHRTELQQIEAQLRQKRAKLALLEAGPKLEEIKLAEAEVETARTEYEQARRQLEEQRAVREERLQKLRADIERADVRLKLASARLRRQRELFEQDVISMARFEELEAGAATRDAELRAVRAERQQLGADRLAEFVKQAATAKTRWSEAEQRLELLQSGPRAEEIAAAEAEIEKLEARRRYLQGLIAKTKIASPIAGVVTTPRMDELRHKQMGRGEVVAEVARLERVRVELSVSEKDMDEVRLDRPVEVRVLAYPGRTFRGRVTSIAPAPAAADDDEYGRSYIVRTQIDNESSLLKPGMTGRAKIRCGDRRIMELLARKLSHYVRVEFWSWW